MDALLAACACKSRADGGAGGWRRDALYGGAVTIPGDREDSRHEEWLTELGRATDAAAVLATACFDLARVLGGISSDAMYRQDLGRLERRVRDLADALGSPPPDLAAFVAALPAARATRNDLL